MIEKEVEIDFKRVAGTVLSYGGKDPIVSKIELEDYEYMTSEVFSSIFPKQKFKVKVVKRGTAPTSDDELRREKACGSVTYLGNIWHYSQSEELELHWMFPDEEYENAGIVGASAALLQCVLPRVLRKEGGGYKNITAPTIKENLQDMVDDLGEKFEYHFVKEPAGYEQVIPLLESSEEKIGYKLNVWALEKE